MPKLPAVKPRQVIRFLVQNGFILDYNSGSHFIFTIRRAVVPIHNRDLPKGTLMSLLLEAGFTRKELVDSLAGRWVLSAVAVRFSVVLVRSLPC